MENYPIKRNELLIDVNTFVHQQIHTKMFRDVSFTISQITPTSITMRMDKLWNTQTMGKDPKICK